MPKKRSFPGPIAIIMVVIVLAAVGTWLLPAGQYNKLSVSGVIKNKKLPLKS